MRIMTRRARQLIPRLLLARALQQCFPLARRPSSRPVLTPVHEILRILEKIIAGLESLNRFAQPFHHCLPFQVTVQAHRIPPHRLQIIDVQHVRFSARCQMRTLIAVACSACDSAIFKWLARVMIARIRQRRSHSRRMTMQASRIHRQRQWHLARLQIMRRHVPHLLLRVPVNRRLEPVPLLLEEIGSSSLAGSQKIPKFLPPIQPARVIVALVAQPDLSGFLRDAVTNPRRRVFEIRGNESFIRRPTRIGHRSSSIALVNLPMAGRTSRIGVACSFCGDGTLRPHHSPQQIPSDK